MRTRTRGAPGSRAAAVWRAIARAATIGALGLAAGSLSPDGVAQAGKRADSGARHQGTDLVVRDLPVQPTQVVLITIDALRADFVSFMDHRPKTTPFLDSLAMSSVVFTDAEAACSWTAPSLASLMTSREPSAHGLVKPSLDPKSGKQLSQIALAQSFVTLAETFDAAGWLTVGVPANLHLRMRTGFDQGFDFYYGTANFLDSGPLNQVVLAHVRGAIGAQWRARWRGKQAFLWVHYFDPHDPYEPRGPWIAAYAPDWEHRSKEYPANLMMTDLKKRFPHPDAAAVRLLHPLYDSEIRALDASFQVLCDSLELVRNDILLIVTADHGEEFAEHGGLGHSTTLHREQVHVPLLIRWPRVLKPGRVDTPVSLLDIYPTLVEMLGLPDPGGLRGESLVPILHGRVPVEPRPIFTEVYPDSGMQNSVRLGEWRLIRDFRRTGGRQLYNLREDPGELKDVAAENPDVVQRLREVMMRWRNSMPPAPPDLKDTPIDDPAVVEKLRSLGYIN